MDLDHWSETRGVLDAEGWGWGGKRRHVRGRRMFYGFNLSRALPRAEERSVRSSYFLLFSLVFFFYGASMWDREEQETARRFEIG